MDDDELRQNLTPLKMSAPPSMIKEDSITSIVTMNYSKSEILPKDNNQNKQDPKQKVPSHYEVRKKTCQKLAILLQRGYNMDKLQSQQITRTIEEKINNLYSNAPNDYKGTMKELLIIIKVN